MTTKADIRAHIRQLRQQHTAAQLRAMSQPIVARLEAHPLFQSAHTILLYHSLPDEVDTHQLISRHSTTKHILLPSVAGDTLRLHSYSPTLATGPFGIQESTGPVFADLAAIDLAVIPGVAFTPSGQRLGRGRGYYDRLIPHLACPLLGLCFPFQLLPQLPVEPHDAPINQVIC